MTLEITVLYFAKTTEFYQAWWDSPQRESTAYELLSLLKLWENHSTGNKSLGLKDKGRGPGLWEQTWTWSQVFPAGRQRWLYEATHDKKWGWKFYWRKLHTGIKGSIIRWAVTSGSYSISASLSIDDWRQIKSPSQGLQLWPEPFSDCEHRQGPSHRSVRAQVRGVTSTCL